MKDEKCSSIDVRNNILPGRDMPDKKKSNLVILKNNVTANSL